MLLSALPRPDALITLALVFLFTTLLAELMSNGATVAMVLFAASASFLSPVGYPSNLMVFGPGRW